MVRQSFLGMAINPLTAGNQDPVDPVGFEVDRHTGGFHHTSHVGPDRRHDPNVLQSGRSKAPRDPAYAVGALLDRLSQLVEMLGERLRILRVSRRPEPQQHGRQLLCGVVVFCACMAVIRIPPSGPFWTCWMPRTSS